MYNPFDWDFDDNSILIPRGDGGGGASEERVNEIVDDKLDTISLSGDNLEYTLTVNGREAGTINIPKDQFLKNVTYNEETKQLVFTMETEEGETVTNVDISDLVTPLVEDIQNITVELSSKVSTETFEAQIQQKETEITALNNELYSLKKIVGDIGGSVTYEVPMEGKSFTSVMSNNGTVKLTEDISSGRYGPGMMASNKTTVNFGKYTLEMNATGDMPGIMARGTQELTFTGGTNGKLVNYGGGSLMWCNSENAVINIKGGSTSTYECNRPNAELIYCYAGTINISGGIFKNNGSNYLLNCYDANYRNGTAKIIVTGGKFYDFDPGNNVAEGEGTSFLAEGYTTIQTTETIDGVEHNVYTVKRV